MGTPFKRTYATAQALRRDADAYFRWCDENPIRGQRTVKKDGDEKETRDDQFPRPYTFEGLALFVGLADWHKFVQRNIQRKGFEEVFDYIRNRIRQNQIEGSLVGLYREGLTARLNGIAENLNVKSDVPAPTIVKRYKGDK